MKKMIINGTLLILAMLVATFVAGIGCWCLAAVLDTVIDNHGVYFGILEYVCTYYCDDNTIVFILSSTMLGSFFMAKLLIKFSVKEAAKRFITSFQKMKLDRQVKWLV